ncbi:hypothetical protein DITRI_Ditri09bG0030200 [Diplodiscus trichospermus]
MKTHSGLLGYLTTDEVLGHDDVVYGARDMGVVFRGHAMAAHSWMAVKNGLKAPWVGRQGIEPISGFLILFDSGGFFFEDSPCRRFDGFFNIGGGGFGADVAILRYDCHRQVHWDQRRWTSTTNGAKNDSNQ